LDGAGIARFDNFFWRVLMASVFILSSGANLAPTRPYAERAEQQPGWHDQAANLILTAVLRPLRALLFDPSRRLRSIVCIAQSYESRFRMLSDAELSSLARRMRSDLRRDGFTVHLVGECFALVSEVAARSVGKRHYPSQLIAGWGMLQGRLVEMETGEGKTFAATLPACVVALAGYPVHVITVNDYLAVRDAQEMGPLYRLLGLDVGVVIQGMTKTERREAYAKSITYCTNKELAFDYLRDRAALARRSSRLHLALERLRSDSTLDKELVLRGLYFGLVDEADSVLIDEARTPLILAASARVDDERSRCERALSFAADLIDGEHYLVNQADRNVILTTLGEAKLAQYAEDLDGIWTSPRARRELVTKALTARILFLRDQHYVVNDGKIQIVDESTGRVMPDRSWEHGLHQLIEAKEGCELTERRETIARLTYQRLLGRYLRLSGMTGTAKEVAREIGSVYGLEVVRVPLHQPSRRTYGQTLTCMTLAEKWNAVADSVERTSRGAGRPVLIGTRSVKASEDLSKILTERGIEHALLNAKQDKSEAQVIALAGNAGRVTVATNMAGRGTDICLGSGVAELGGMHVILTEYHESRRIDRQLFGRCARQGDPGSCEVIVSLEDEIFAVHTPIAARFLSQLSKNNRRLPRSVFKVLRVLAQFAVERRSAWVRRQNLKVDRQLDQMLAFAGSGE
jgi:preprotein translocase subunit SecA